MTPITSSGIYDLDHQTYLADPVEGGSISSSIAKKLTPPRPPAKYWHETQNPTPATDSMDLGSVAHDLLLGGGAPVRVIDAADWRSNAARAERNKAREAGQIAILERDYQTAKNMTTALQEQHPDWYSTLDEALTEKTFVWRDHRGVWCRAKIDYYNPSTSLIVDYKTTSNADLSSLERAIYQYQYHQQAAWYLDAVRNTNPFADDLRFCFLFQETTAPYLSTMVHLVGSALEWGHEMNQLAVEVWRDCRASGVWPGYPVEQYAALPGWAIANYKNNHQH